MAITDILVHLDLTETSKNAFTRAIEFAQRQNARLTALYVDNWVFWVNGFGTEMSPGLIDAQSEIAASRKQKVKSYADTLQAKSNIQLKWIEEVCDPALAICKNAHSSDVIVLGHSSSATDLNNSNLVHTVAFESGRPIIVIPSSYTKNFSTKNILIACNHSKEASRAIHDAFTLLQQAESNLILAIGREQKELENKTDALVEHLQQHGISSQANVEALGNTGVGETILNAAQSQDSNLIVMGCYGHTRLREMILGGCTRYIFQHTQIPLWVSH